MQQNPIKTQTPNNYETVYSVSDGTLQIEQESLLKITRRRTDNEMYGEAAWLFQTRPSSATIGPKVTQKLYSIQYDEHGIPIHAQMTRQSRKCKPINIGTGRPWLHTTYGAKSFGVLRKKKLDPWWIWNTFAERDPTKVQVRVTSAGWILEPSIWQKQREEASAAAAAKAVQVVKRHPYQEGRDDRDNKPGKEVGWWICTSDGGKQWHPSELS